MKRARQEEKTAQGTVLENGEILNYIMSLAFDDVHTWHRVRQVCSQWRIDISARHLKVTVWDKSYILHLPKLAGLRHLELTWNTRLVVDFSEVHIQLIGIYCLSLETLILDTAEQQWPSGWLVHLHSLVKLKVLHIQYFTDNAMQALFSCFPALETLHLLSLHLLDGADSLIPIHSLPNPQKIRKLHVELVDTCKIPQALRVLSGVTNLCIDSPIDDHEEGFVLQNLGNLENLKRLTLNDFQTIQSIEFEGMQRLEYLKLKDCPLPNGARQIACFSALKFLCVSGNNEEHLSFNDEDLHLLAKSLPRLVSLDMNGQRITQSSSAKSLALFKMLKKLTFSGCTVVTGTFLEQALSHMNFLTSLSLKNSPNLGDESLKVISQQLPQLTLLDLGDCKITGDGIKHLNLQNLLELKF